MERLPCKFQIIMKSYWQMAPVFPTWSRKLPSVPFSLVKHLGSVLTSQRIPWSPKDSEHGPLLQMWKPLERRGEVKWRGREGLSAPSQPPILGISCAFRPGPRLPLVIMSTETRCWSRNNKANFGCVLVNQATCRASSCLLFTSSHGSRLYHGFHCAGEEPSA